MAAVATNITAGMDRIGAPHQHGQDVTWGSRVVMAVMAAVVVVVVEWATISKLLISNSPSSDTQVDREVSTVNNLLCTTSSQCFVS